MSTGTEQTPQQRAAQRTALLLGLVALAFFASAFLFLGR